MKKKSRIFVCILTSLLASFTSSCVYAETQTQTIATQEPDGETDNKTQQEEIPEIVESVNLKQGSTCYLDFPQAGGKAKIRMMSDNPEIVTVSSKGKVIPKKCGTTYVRVNWKKGKSSQGAVICVHVKYDSFLSVTNYGKELKKSSSDSETVKFVFHRELKKGKTAGVKLRGIGSGAKVSYQSSKPEIASVDREGNITAKKEGTSVVEITINQNGIKYSFYEAIHVKNSKDGAKKITEKERNSWFSDSGFIGSSIGVGQKMYFDSQGKGYLGNPAMMVKDCYSFMNDSASSTKYKITYRGTPYQARTAVKKYGLKKVFINMGMNDLWESPEGVYKRYISYLSGIKKDSPGIVIFIESTTPVTSGNEKQPLSNKNVNKLNAMMKKYCDSQKDMYYIDVNSCLKGADGCLKKSYSSDGYVHLSMSGYGVWMEALCDYTDKLMISEKIAEDAVKTAQESRQKADYTAAKKLVNKLEKSTVKDRLNQKLQKIKIVDLPRITGSAPAMVQTSFSVQSTKVVPETEIIEHPQSKPLASVRIRKIAAQSNTTLKVSWTKSKGAGYYRIYRSSKKNGQYKAVGGTTKTAWRDKKCRKNKKYYYKVRACLSKLDGNRKSVLSEAVAGHTRNVPGKVVLAGDSVMEGVSSYHVVDDIHSPGKKSVVAYKGLGTLTFQTKEVFRGMTGVDRVVSAHPDRLYLMLGMNEISYRSTKDMLKNYQEIIDQIKDESHKTEIILLAVSPVSKGTVKKTKGFSKIPGWNKQVRKLAKKNGCRYLDYTRALKGKDGYLKYNGGDGIHWNISGYHAFIKEIEKYEKKINR